MKVIVTISALIVLAFHLPDSAKKNDVKEKQLKPETGNEIPLFSFGLIADAQYADCSPVGERHYRNSLGKLTEAVDEFRNDSVSFIVNLGDLIDRDYESFKPALGILNSSGIRVYSVAGNHDYSVDPRYFGRLPVFTESREGYYSIIYRKYRFIFTNGNEISTYSTASRSSKIQAEEYLASLRKKGEQNAIDWNGGMSESQLAWIKEQLDEAAGDSEKVVFFCHFPLAPDNIHNLLNYKEVISLLDRYNNITAWFSGHNHQGSYVRLKNTHYVTLCGMVETKKDNSFAVVEVYPQRMVFKGFGREMNLELDY